MTAGTVTQLGYLVVGVSDETSWRAFAAEVLGFEVSGGAVDGGLRLRMDAHAYRILLEATGTDDIEVVGWQVAGPADLDGVRSRLADRGIETDDDVAELVARRRVGDLVRFRDPDGLAVEVYWGPELAVGEHFVPGRRISGFKAGELGLGHVVLVVDDVARAAEFYQDVLGFLLSDHGSGPFAFLRCNARHHSLALGPAELVRSEKRLLHFMVEMNELDDVGTAYDICHERDIPIAITLGRHTNDQMLSFYARTPSEFRFECGWGGLLVGDDWQVRRYTQREVWGHHRVEESLKAPPARVGDEDGTP